MVCGGVTADEPIAECCAVQFCRGRSDKSTPYLEAPVVKEQQVGAFHLLVRAASHVEAGKLADTAVLNRLTTLAGQLSFRPEIQVRGNRIMVYLADRNASIDDVETLRSLFDFAGNITERELAPINV